MHLPHDAMLLRIFIEESDRWHHQPLYEAIVFKAREVHLAGATVLRGPMGFGKSSRLHTAKVLPNRSATAATRIPSPTSCKLLAPRCAQCLQPFNGSGGPPPSLAVHQIFRTTEGHCVECASA